MRSAWTLDRTGTLVVISKELVTRIRHLFFAEHWKIGTIASELGVHVDTVRRAINAESFKRGASHREHPASVYLDFIRETLERHPRLRATRIHEMLRVRGYQGSVRQLRRFIAPLRPKFSEAFVRLHFFPGEQAQVDWAHFGKVNVGKARRTLSGFVLILSYSRVFYLEFFFDQTLENFLRGHVRAFDALGGSARNLLYDNLRSAVLERFGNQARFHPRLLELCAHYHCQPRLCRPARANEKGRVERAISFIRRSFFEGRTFTNLAELNRQASQWCEQVRTRPHPNDKTRTVGELYEEEKPLLLPLPEHPFDTDWLKPVRSRKTIYIHYDLNDYSIPPQALGKNLTLAASDTHVRFLDSNKVLTTHRRTYDRDQVIERPEHRQALLKLKRSAQAASPSTRLNAVPQAQDFLKQAFKRGDAIVPLTKKLELLLDDYGEIALQQAIQEALEQNTPQLSSVAFLLKKHRAAHNRRPPLPVQLDKRPDLANIHIRPHPLEIYDELSKTDDNDDE